MARDPAVLAKLPTPKFVDARVGRGMHNNQDFHLVLLIGCFLPA
jgi:hypothetical protein